MDCFNSRIFQILTKDKDYIKHDISVYMDMEKRHDGEPLCNVVFEKDGNIHKIFYSLVFTSNGKSKVMKFIPKKKGYDIIFIDFTEQMRLDEIKYFVMKKFKLLDDV